ncbi:MAG: FeoB-associated Cys-rich membrane protein [Eubacteriales bacterium]|nr:FeoB-associated Cys-rich membrane protein [Eubacteriales bacterium]
MIDFVVGAILIVVVGSALAYIIKARKNGIKCVGCPDAKNCGSCSHTGEAVSTCGCHGGACAGCSCHADVK